MDEARFGEVQRTRDKYEAGSSLTKKDFNLNLDGLEAAIRNDGINGSASTDHIHLKLVDDKILKLMCSKKLLKKMKNESDARIFRTRAGGNIQSFLSGDDRVPRHNEALDERIHNRRNTLHRDPIDDYTHLHEEHNRYQAFAPTATEDRNPPLENVIRKVGSISTSAEFSNALKVVSALAVELSNVYDKFHDNNNNYVIPTRKTESREITRQNRQNRRIPDNDRARSGGESNPENSENAKNDEERRTKIRQVQSDPDNLLSQQPKCFNPMGADNEKDCCEDSCPYHHYFYRSICRDDRCKYLKMKEYPQHECEEPKAQVCDPSGVQSCSGIEFPQFPKEEIRRKEEVKKIREMGKEEPPKPSEENPEAEETEETKSEDAASTNEEEAQDEPAQSRKSEPSEPKIRKRSTEQKFQTPERKSRPRCGGNKKDLIAQRRLEACRETILNKLGAVLMAEHGPPPASRNAARHYTPVNDEHSPDCPRSKRGSVPRSSRYKSGHEAFALPEDQKIQKEQDNSKSNNSNLRRDNSLHTFWSQSNLTKNTNLHCEECFEDAVTAPDNNNALSHQLEDEEKCHITFYYDLELSTKVEK